MAYCVSLSARAEDDAYAAMLQDAELANELVWMLSRRPAAADIAFAASVVFKPGEGMEQYGSVERCLSCVFRPPKWVRRCEQRAQRDLAVDDVRDVACGEPRCVRAVARRDIRSCS